jgi:aminomethyltransferase
VGQVIYTPWCDEHGKVVDDGTIHRIGEQELRWTAADPPVPVADHERLGPGRAGRGRLGAGRRARPPGPLQPRGPRGGDRRGLRRPALLPAPRAKLAGVEIDVSRTGYTGDLGYELWIPAEAAAPAWDALFAAGQAYAIRPAGMYALDVTRLEAGLILLEVDYTSPATR